MDGIKIMLPSSAEELESSSLSECCFLAQSDAGGFLFVFFPTSTEVILALSTGNPSRVNLFDEFSNKLKHNICKSYAIFISIYLPDTSEVFFLLETVTLGEIACISG